MRNERRRDWICDVDVVQLFKHHKTHIYCYQSTMRARAKKKQAGKKEDVSSTHFLLTPITIWSRKSQACGGYIFMSIYP